MANRYFAHQELIKRFKLLATKQIPGLRIFDRTVGMFFVKRVTDGFIDYNPITINKPGMADAYGLIKTKSGLVHIELEFKTGKAVQTKEQVIWEQFISSMGGLYLLVRDEKQAIEYLKGYINGLN